MTDLVPPGHQAALFVLPGGREQYQVIDATGTIRLTTAALGIAYTVAQRLADDAGQAWITARDGTAARLNPDGTVTTATPRPWIDTIRHAHGGTTHDHDHHP